MSIPSPGDLSLLSRILIKLGTIDNKLDRLGEAEGDIKGLEDRVRRAEYDLGILSAKVSQTTATWIFMWHAANTILTLALGGLMAWRGM